MPFFNSRRASRALTVLSLITGCAVAGVPAHHAAAQAIITGNTTTMATVETVDASTGEILLRGDDGDLFTIDMPARRHALPHLNVADRLSVRSFKTLDATLAEPGTPQPESTVSTARGYANRHPHGTLVSFRRRRVRVISTNLTAHTLTVADASGAPKEVLITRTIFYPLLASLKKGDEVDVTTMDAVSYTVMNRTVAPNVQVQQQAGSAAQPGAVAPQSPAPVAPQPSAAAQ
ncbi:hypothetical protein [Acetobacter conturbans]|uniref:hypothetical protein n=1 Tax=Acetobacter conturbans TaxID=1737472 RepID=UPI0015691C00|nr:hypothetical protein [Acetobacter conturbans]